MIMSEQLEQDFKTCMERVIESKYEDDKINCCIMDLKTKVLREMAIKHDIFIEMLYGFIQVGMFLENEGRGISDIIKIIEKATGKTWQETKELL